MKYIYNLCLFISLSTGLLAQTIFEENFTNGMPTDFYTYDVDGLNVHPNINNLGLQLQGNGWGIRSLNNGDQVAVSTSWYQPAGQSNDWLVTSEINIPGNDFYLLFDARSVDGSFRDGYEVRLSTQGSSTLNFTTTLLSVPEENPGSDYTTRSIDLSAYSGQNVRFAFINNSNDMFLLYINKIWVTNEVNKDTAEIGDFGFRHGVIDDIKSRYATDDAPVSFSFTVDNLGVTEINNFEVSLSLNGTISKQLVTQSINPLENITIESPLTLNFNTPGNYNAEVWISEVNGVTVSNPKKLTKSFTAFENFTSRLPLVEIFTSSTCGPCATQSANIYSQVHPQQMSNVYGAAQIGVIKNQINIPSNGDPSNNAHANARQTTYGVNSAPSVFLDGKRWSFGQAENINTWGDARNLYIAALDYVSNRRSFVELEAKYSVNNGLVKTEVDLKSLEDLDGSYSVHIAVLNAQYEFLAATNGETNYSHVMRRYLPSQLGTVFIDLKKNQIENIAEEFMFNIGNVTPGTFNLWDENLEVIVFVQDNSDLSILQTAIAKKEINPLLTPTIDELSGVSIFPNPTTGVFTISFDELNDELNYAVFDLMGKAVSQGRITNNYEVVDLNVESGIYFVRVFGDKIEKTFKIVVNN